MLRPRIMKPVAYQLQSVSDEGYRDSPNSSMDAQTQLTLPLEINSHYPEYLWHPEVLANASHSAEYLSKRLNAEIETGKFTAAEQFKEYIDKEYVQNGLGIMDASDSELQLIVLRPRAALYYFANMISRRAHIGWSTHGHSAVDVNIYGTSGTDRLRGNHENTDVGKFLREYLDVDVDKITEELISGAFNIATDSSSGWTGRIPTNQDISFPSKPL